MALHEEAEVIFTRLVKAKIFKPAMRNAFNMGYLDGRWTSPEAMPGYGVLPIRDTTSGTLLYYGPLAKAT